MPYRRLPNTDQSRLKALHTAIQKADEQGFSEQVINYNTLSEARKFCINFERHVAQYQQIFEKKVTANRHYRHITANARMYISHFIQVLNLAVIRGDIKKEQKELYHLNPNTHNVPSLTTDRAILKWGKNIIDGENERLRLGGGPIYNPTIAKVKVHYDIFKECQSTQELYKSNTSRNWSELDKLRERANEIILEIWNQVEEHHKDLLPYARLTACKAYGIIYYYRKNEERITPETDRAIQKLERRQQKLNF